MKIRDLSRETTLKLVEIKLRMKEYQEEIRQGAVLESGKLVVKLEFESEEELTNRYLLLLSDVVTLVAVLDGVEPI